MGLVGWGGVVTFMLTCPIDLTLEMVKKSFPKCLLVRVYETTGRCWLMFCSGVINLPLMYLGLSLCMTWESHS